MKAGAIINARLIGDAAVAAIVGTRVHPILVPLEVDLPAVAYQVSLEDSTGGTAPLQRCTVTIHCMAHDDNTADALAIVADAALSNYTARSGTTYLYPMERIGWDEFRDPEQDVWGRTLTYRTWISF